MTKKSDEVIDLRSSAKNENKYSRYNTFGTSSATTAAFTSSAFTNKSKMEEGKTHTKKGSTTVYTNVTKTYVTEEYELQRDKSPPKLIKSFTQSSKDFKQNPAKFKIPSKEDIKEKDSEGGL